MWSISRLDAFVKLALSYGLIQVPDWASQALLTWTPVPSRFSTYSLFNQGNSC